jgi:hypothetical protein
MEAVASGMQAEYEEIVKGGLLLQLDARSGDGPPFHFKD